MKTWSRNNPTSAAALKEGILSDISLLAESYFIYKSLKDNKNMTIKESISKTIDILETKKHIHESVQYQTNLSNWRNRLNKVI
jgi:hypothetical protein